MVGAVIILIVMVVLGPIAVMMGGAVWTAIQGWALVEDANERYSAEEGAGEPGQRT